MNENTELVWLAILLAVMVLALIFIGIEVLTKRMFGISLSDKLLSLVDDEYDPYE